MEFEEAAPVLEAIGMAAAKEQALDQQVLAEELDLTIASVGEFCTTLQAMGLVMLAPEDEPELPPLLLEAGSQYLRMKGDIDRDCLYFLPIVIDDLHARQALLHGGAFLFDEFRYQLAQGDGAEHAAMLVPPAFAEAVDEHLAVDLFAAAVALLARLSAGRAAGCVAEEIIAVRLMEEAECWLDMRADQGEITKDEAKAAKGALTGLFELFEDDDVLNMFEMEEPADASVAGHDFINRQMGVADQCIEAWFRPFGGVPATGHLAEREKPGD